MQFLNVNQKSLFALNEHLTLMLPVGKLLLPQSFLALPKLLFSGHQLLLLVIVPVSQCCKSFSPLLIMARISLKLHQVLSYRCPPERVNVVLDKS